MPFSTLCFVSCHNASFREASGNSWPDQVMRSGHPLSRDDLVRLDETGVVEEPDVVVDGAALREGSVGRIPVVRQPR